MGIISRAIISSIVFFSGAGLRIERSIKRSARILERSFPYRSFVGVLSLADSFSWSSSLFRGDFFSPWNFLAAYSFLYLLLAYTSFIPVLSYSTWAVSAALFLLGVSLTVLSAGVFAGLGLKWRRFDFAREGRGLLAVGTLAVLLNYLVVGVPILSASLRTAFHNAFYQLFFIAFVLGLALTAARLRRMSEVFALAAFGGALSFLSGFRTDFIMSVAPVLLTAVYTGVLNVRRLFFLLALLFSSALLLKVILLFSGGSGAGVDALVGGRAGFTFYVLGSVYEACGFSGCGNGVLFLNSFLQFFAHRIVIGGFGAEFSSWLPRFFTSSFVGPLLLDGGVVGIVIGSFFVGSVLGALYSLKKSGFFAALYSVAIWYSFIWIETGPIQPYFLALHLLFIFLISRLARR